MFSINFTKGLKEKKPNNSLHPMNENDVFHPKGLDLWSAKCFYFAILY